MTLAEELVLLAYDDEGKRELGEPALDYGIAGAVLLELALAGKVDVRDKLVAIIDATPCGDELADSVLARIGANEKPREPTHWVETLSKGLRDRVLDRLIAAGVLRREKDKVLWVFPVTRYPTRDGATPPAELSARQRLVAAVASEARVDERTAALCALVRGTGLERDVFKGLPKDQVKKRLKDITEGDWVGAAVRRAIQEVEEAMAASTAAIAVTTVVINNS